MTDAQKYRMHLVCAHMDSITSENNNIDKQISSRFDYDKAIWLLTTILDVERDNAINITSELGIDMSKFYNSKRFVWEGLTPGNNESNRKKKSVRITHAGVYLKPALAQCTHVAVKSDKYPYYKKKH